MASNGRMTTCIYYSSEANSGTFKAMEDDPINIQRVGLETRTGTYPCLYIKRLSLFSDFNQNCNVTRDVSVVTQSQISFMAIQHCFSDTTDTQKDGWGNVMGAHTVGNCIKWQHSRCPYFSLPDVYDVQLIYRKPNSMFLYTYEIKMFLWFIRISTTPWRHMG
jgi:hypothetical protein